MPPAGAAAIMKVCRICPVPPRPRVCTLVDCGIMTNVSVATDSVFHFDFENESDSLYCNVLFCQCEGRTTKRGCAGINVVV